MSVVFFLSIFTAFLYFCAFYILSPKRNPKYKALMEHKNAPTDEALQLTAIVFNAVAMVLTVVLVATIPFLRAMAAIGMAGLAVRFFYRRRFGTGKANGSPLGVNMHDDPRNAASESDESPGTGGGTSH